MQKQEDLQRKLEEQRDDAAMAPVGMLIMGLLSLFIGLPIMSLILGPVGSLVGVMFTGIFFATSFRMFVAN